MFFVYILKSLKDNMCYIGYTSNLKRRVEEHNQGRAQSPKPRTPLKLIYYEAYISKEDAKKREQRLKLKSRAYAQLRKRIESSSET